MEDRGGDERDRIFRNFRRDGIVRRVSLAKGTNVTNVALAKRSSRALHSHLGLACFLLIIAVCCVQDARADERPAAADLRKLIPALSATEEFLRLVDAGAYRETWNTVAPVVRTQTLVGAWTTALANARRGLGRRGHSELRGSRETNKVPGAPPGDFVVLLLSTSFDAGRAEETVTLMRVDQKWLVAGYFVRRSGPDAESST